MKKLFIAISLVLSAVAFAAEGEPRISKGKKFVHPGIFYTQGDIDRMKAMVAAGREPWRCCFEGLKASRWTGPGVFARGRGMLAGPRSSPRLTVEVRMVVRQRRKPPR